MLIKLYNNKIMNRFTNHTNFINIKVSEDARGSITPEPLNRFEKNFEST